MSDLITTPRTEFVPAFDLTQSHAVHTRGSITVWMTWNRLTGRPAMVLTPTDMHLSPQRTIPCVITLDTAHIWDEERGDLMHANIVGALFCANLGYNPHNAKNVLRLQGYIRDYLEDLIRMPPMPDETRAPVAEMLVIDNSTGAETVKEISDYA